MRYHRIEKIKQCIHFAMKRVTNSPTLPTSSIWNTSNTCTSNCCTVIKINKLRMLSRLAGWRDAGWRGGGMRDKVRKAVKCVDGWGEVWGQGGGWELCGWLGRVEAEVRSEVRSDGQGWTGWRVESVWVAKVRSEGQGRVEAGNVWVV